MADTDERYTPEGVLNVVRLVAPIGLDPCTIARNPTGARFFYTAEEDGLQAAWALCPPGELIYVNPPYSRGMLMQWAQKVVAHANRGANDETIVLTPCDLGTQWATLLFEHAHALAGWQGRIAFELPDGSYDQGAKQPSIFWYFGERAQRFVRFFGQHANVTTLGGR